MLQAPKKASAENDISVAWIADERNSKSLSNFPKLYETHLLIAASAMFAGPKVNKMGTYIERGYQPNTVMSEVARANHDYTVLKNMFRLH
jgi:hypothetical protein